MGKVTKPVMLDETGKQILEALTQSELTQERIAEINRAAEEAKIDVIATSEEAIQAVETKANTAKNEVEEKVNQQLGRIPEVTEIHEEVSQIKYELSDYRDAGIAFDLVGYISQNGLVGNIDAYACTDYIDITSNGLFIPIGYTVYAASHMYVCYYNDDKKLVKSVQMATASQNKKVTGVIEYVQGAKYVRLSTYKSASDTDYGKTYYATPKNEITDGAIVNDMIANHTINTDRLAFSRHDPKTNYIKADEARIGYIGNDGEVRFNNSWCYTGYVQLNPGISYYGSGFYFGGYYAFYDEDFNIVQLGSSDLPNPFTIPDNAVYGRFSANATTLEGAWIHTENKQPVPYAEILDVKVNGYVESNQGAENFGKVLTVDNNGDVVPVKQNGSAGVDTNVYRVGDLLKLNEVTNGYIKSDGTVRDYATLWCSGFCPVVYPGKVYINRPVVNQYYAFYDANKDLVASYSTVPMERFSTYTYCVDVPEGAEYFRCSFQSDVRTKEDAIYFITQTPEMPYAESETSIANIYPYTMNPQNPCDYSEQTVSVFNKCACIGDSLTYGGFNMNNAQGSSGVIPDNAELSQKYSYPTQFKKITGVETVNFGVSGVTTAQWYERFKDTDFSSFDMAIIHLGVNDGAHGVSDAETKMAFTNIITMLKNQVKNIKVYICTIIPAYANKEHASYLQKSSLIRQYYEETYANDPDVVLLDIERYGHARAYTSYTAGHLSAIGYYMFAKDLARYISWHIDNNLRDYRFIQFIGNDGYYSGD